MSLDITAINLEISQFFTIDLTGADKIALTAMLRKIPGGAKLDAIKYIRARFNLSFYQAHKVVEYIDSNFDLIQG